MARMAACNTCPLACAIAIEGRAGGDRLSLISEGAEGGGVFLGRQIVGHGKFSSATLRQCVRRQGKPMARPMRRGFSL
jgi:hypothetical protein